MSVPFVTLSRRSLHARNTPPKPSLHRRDTSCAPGALHTGSPAGGQPATGAPLASTRKRYASRPVLARLRVSDHARNAPPKPSGSIEMPKLVVNESATPPAVHVR